MKMPLGASVDNYKASLKPRHIDLLAKVKNMQEKPRMEPEAEFDGQG